MNRPIVVPAWTFLLIFCLLIGGVFASITITPGAPTAIPTAGIILTDAATCPGTTTEYTDARGRMLVGVPSGGTIEGTVGTALTNTQNLSVAPAFTGNALGTHTHPVTANGTVAAPVFTGSALATHQHETQYISVTGGTTFRVVDNPFGTGVSRTPEQAATSSANSSAGNVSLVQAISGGTPAGTNTAPNFTGEAVTSGATGGGTPAGTNSAVTTGGIAPYIQLRLCQQ